MGADRGGRCWSRPWPWSPEPRWPRPARAGASTARAARLVSATAGPGLTDPTGDHHGFRHGAVPRIISSGGPVGHFAVPEQAPAVAGGRLLHYGGGLTAGGLVGAGVTTGPPRVYLVFLGSQWGTEGTGRLGRATFGNDPEGEAGALQVLYGGLGTDGELWSGTVTQYCDGVAVGATSCGSAGQAVPYPTGDVLAGVWYDNSAIGTARPPQAPPATSWPWRPRPRPPTSATPARRPTATPSTSSPRPPAATPTGGTIPRTGYCAYHDDTHDPTIDGGGPVAGPIVAFTNLPYVPDAGGSCGAGSVNHPGLLDGATEAASHEYAETVTDQFPEAHRRGVGPTPVARRSPTCAPTSPHRPPGPPTT